MSNTGSHVLYADEDYAVFYKPAGMPSAPLTPDDTNNALYEASKEYPRLLSVVSKYKEIEKGLIHRIDTNTSGLILFAGNQRSYDALVLQQEKNEFIKYYTAIVKESSSDMHQGQGKKGFPPCPYSYCSLPLLVKSSFRKFGPGGKEVRPAVMEHMSYYAKIKSVPFEYETELSTLEPVFLSKTASVLKVCCKITKGFRHQVRCHLSWLGLPIVGDEVYGVKNSDVLLNNKMLFAAHALEFFSPGTNQRVSYTIESCLDSIFFTSESR